MTPTYHVAINTTNVVALVISYTLFPSDRYAIMESYDSNTSGLTPGSIIDRNGITKPWDSSTFLLTAPKFAKIYDKIFWAVDLNLFR